MQAQIVHGSVGCDAEQSLAMGTGRKKIADEKAVPWTELADYINGRFPSIAEAARECGIPYRNFQHYVSGKRGAKAPMIRKICEGLKISPNRLFGYVAPPDELPDDERALLANYRATQPEHRRVISEQAKSLAEIDNPPFPRHVRNRT